ncbi:MAG: ribonuclease HI family protein [Syntrophothermus sp.]
MERPIYIHSDGGARGNPGPAGIGYVILDEDKRVLAQGSQYIGETTNNVAEYTALKQALLAAARLGDGPVEVFSDSELMVKQINGEYKVKHANLQPLHAEVRDLLRRFRSYKVTHVRRELNKEADALVNASIDAHFRQARSQPAKELPPDPSIDG